MLTPPSLPPEADPAPKRSEAVFTTDRLQQLPGGWTREVTFMFDGEDYQYSLVARHNLGTEQDARKVLYGPTPDKELQSAFLREVRLDMTRPH
jgi:hypothetical protein